MLLWQDSRCVKVMSTQHDDSMQLIRRRRKGVAGVEEVEKPVMVCEYNKYMSGVDHIDQMISYYPVVRKTRKWHKKLFFYFVEVCIHNAHVVFQHYNVTQRGRKVPLLDFQLEIVKALCCDEEEEEEVELELEEEVVEEEEGEEEEEVAAVVPAPHPQPAPAAPRKDPRSRLTGGGGFNQVQ
jgi:hypothetical protein